MGDIVMFTDPVVLQIPWSLHPSLKQSKNKFTEGSESAEKKNHQELRGTSKCGIISCERAHRTLKTCAE